MDSDFARLARRQLSVSLSKYRLAALAAPQPKLGWLAAIRGALEMSKTQLATRMNIANSGVVRIERGEMEGSISLATLRNAANAMDCDLVYALVPRVDDDQAKAHPELDNDRLLDDLILREARRVALAEATQVGRTMALEDQAVSDSALRPQVSDRATELAKDPGQLWDLTASSRTKQHARKRGRPKRV